MKEPVQAPVVSRTLKKWLPLRLEWKVTSTSPATVEIWVEPVLDWSPPARPAWWRRAWQWLKERAW